MSGLFTFKKRSFQEINELYRHFAKWFIYLRELSRQIYSACGIILLLAVYEEIHVV